MRIRSIAVIVGVFAAAALVSLLVVRQIAFRGVRQAPPAPPSDATPVPRPTPALEPPATEVDGHLELLATAAGAPIEGAEVRLYLALPPEAGALAPAWRRAGEARTDATGTARLAARAGTYLVAVRAEGMGAANAQVIRHRGEDVTRTELALEPAVALEVHVTSRPDGLPAAARVTAFPAVGRAARFGPPSAPVEEQLAASADATGTVRFPKLAPGGYAVAAEAAGLHPALRPRVSVPRGGPLAIALEPLGRIAGVVRDATGRPAVGAIVRGASRDHEGTATCDGRGRFTLAVPAGSYLVSATAGDGAGGAGPVPVRAGATTDGVELALGPAAAVEGAVVEASSGRPVPGAEVALFPHETGSLAARAVTGEDGRYRLAALAAGQYDVRAAAAGKSPALQRGVTLEAGRSFPLDVALAGTGVVAGLVTDTRARPLAGARVRIEARGDGLEGALGLEVRSAFDGSYRIEGVEVGRAELVASQEGVDLGVSRAVRVAPGATGRADFELPDPGLLVGRVTQDGRPAPLGTAVVAVPMKAGLGTAQAARAVADASGSYRFVLPAGEYRLHGAPADADRTDLRAAPAFARVEPGKTVRRDVAAAKASAEEGLEVVVLEPGGAPSPGAVVTLSRADDDRIALATSAGEDGRIVLAKEMGLAGVPVTVRARSGGRSGVFTGTLPEAGSVALRLERGGAIEGVVRSAGAAPRSLVVEVASQPSASAWRTTDVHRFAGARFELGDLPTGPLRLTVRADDGRRGTAELSLAPGETRRVEIALGPGGR